MRGRGGGCVWVRGVVCVRGRGGGCVWVRAGPLAATHGTYVPFLVFNDLNVMFLCEVHCLIPVLPHACVQEISLHTSTASM